MNWISTDQALPEPGHASVLTYGYNAFDVVSRVRYEFCMRDQHGTAYWSQSDVVTHWCALDGVLTPDEVDA